MLRMMLRFKTGTDELFVKILRDFIHEYSGKDASTEDFLRIIEKDAPGDWHFFFNAWIYRTGIPTYTYGYKVDGAGEGFNLTVTFKRSGVPADSWSPVPFRIEFQDGTSGVFFMPGTKSEESVTLPVAKKVKGLTLGPNHSVLAVIKEE